MSDASVRQMFTQAHDKGRRLCVNGYAMGGKEKQRNLAFGPQNKITLSQSPSVKREYSSIGARSMDFFHTGSHEAGDERIAEAAEKVRVHDVQSLAGRSAALYVFAFFLAGLTGYA